MELQSLVYTYRYLHLAICNEDRFAIKALLERIKKEKLTYMVDQENNDRQTPLFVAVAMNDPAKVQLLINAGANLNTLAQVGGFIFYPNSNMADRRIDRSFKQLLLS